jgi:hypothetical protein
VPISLSAPQTSESPSTFLKSLYSRQVNFRGVHGAVQQIDSQSSLSSVLQTCRRISSGSLTGLEHGYSLHVVPTSTGGDSGVTGGFGSGDFGSGGFGSGASGFGSGGFGFGSCGFGFGSGAIGSLSPQDGSFGSHFTTSQHSSHEQLWPALLTLWLLNDPPILLLHPLSLSPTFAFVYLFFHAEGLRSQLFAIS